MLGASQCTREAPIAIYSIAVVKIEVARLYCAISTQQRKSSRCLRYYFESSSPFASRQLISFFGKPFAHGACKEKKKIVLHKIIYQISTTRISFLVLTRNYVVHVTCIYYAVSAVYCQLGSARVKIVRSDSIHYTHLCSCILVVLGSWLTTGQSQIDLSRACRKWHFFVKESTAMSTKSKNEEGA